MGGGGGAGVMYMKNWLPYCCWLMTSLKMAPWESITTAPSLSPVNPHPPSKLPYSWTETGELMKQLWRKAAFAYGKIIKTNKVTLGPPGERRKREEEVNNVSLERGLIAPHWGCAIYLRLSGSAAVSFVTSEQTRVHVGVLGVSVFKAASCETCALGGRRGKMTQSSPKLTSSFPFC